MWVSKERFYALEDAVKRLEKITGVCAADSGILFEGQYTEPRVPINEVVVKLAQISGVKMERERPPRLIVQKPE